MKQILKRLELIRTAIDLEDNDIIELQVQKIDGIKHDSEVDNILKLISNNDFETVGRFIDSYLHKYREIVIYEDPKVQGLKIELKNFEDILQALSDKKNEYLHTISYFNHRYNIELGTLIERILELQKNRSSNELNGLDSTSEDYENKKRAHEQAKKKYENFNKSYKEQKSKPQRELNKDQQKELKLLYRKASRLCHPDVVADIHKDKAEEIFKMLNEAYSQNDVDKVKEILANLESENNFNVSSNIIDDAIILKQKIQNIKVKIDEIENEIFGISNNDTYITISYIDDFDKYFSDLKTELQEELEELQKAETL